VQAVALILAVLVETTVFAQMPMFLVVPALSAGVLIYLSSRMDRLTMIICSLSTGLLYDFLRESSSSLLYFASFCLLGAAILVWRSQISEDSYETRSNLYYLSLVACTSLIFTVVAAASVIPAIGYLEVMYTIIVQSAFLIIFLAIIRATGRRSV
jgi:hypothetical protein